MAEGAVRSVFIEMVLELLENSSRVSLVDDQDAVEEFVADGAEERTACAWARGNSVHEGPDRRVEGSMPAPCGIVQTVEAPIW